MERIINTLLRCRERNALFSALFFEFHGLQEVNDDWISGRFKVECPPRRLPRIIQEMLIVLALARELDKEEFDAILCLDERACKMALRMRHFLRRNIVVGSWLHRSIHTFKKTTYLTGLDFHIAISEGIKDQLQKISDAPVFLLQNCVDVERVVLEKKRKSPVYLYIGRVELQGQKKLVDLFDAFSLLPEEAQLHIVGSGPDEVVCKEYCSKLNLDKRVFFHGWQGNPWKYISDEIGMVDALCLTSMYEGFPLVLIEGIYQGVFCISSNCETGPADIINDSNGILYPVGDVQALKFAMEKAVVRRFEPEKIVESGSAYSKERYYSELVDIFNKVLCHAK